MKLKIIKLNLIPYLCSECNINEWKGQPFSLHLDHKNGINNDNRLENLRFLCPNCHSQTTTYCGKNNDKYGIKNKKVSDEFLLCAMRNSSNPSKALKNVNLSGAGNYRRVYKLAEEHNIEHMKQKPKNRSRDKYAFDDKEVYDKLLEYNNNYLKTSKFFGCSDNAIRKRIRRYIGGPREI